MRRIALLSVVTFLAACGESSNTPGNGYLRVANLAPGPTVNAGAADIDFCIAPTGGTYSAPVMAAAGSPEGIVYGGTGLSIGLKQMSKYFAYGAGTYDIKVMNKAAGGSCASPLATITGVSLTEGGYRTIAFVGGNPTASTAPAAFALVAFTDKVTVATTQVAIRFMNAGLMPGAQLSPGPTLDIGISSATTANVVIFPSVAYPGKSAASSTIDANGYAVLTANTLPPGNLALNICAAGVPPPSPFCGSANITAGQITGGIVATAYLIGQAQLSSGALFCGDVTNGNALQQFGNFSSCTSALQ